MYPETSDFCLSEVKVDTRYITYQSYVISGLNSSKHVPLTYNFVPIHLESRPGLLFILSILIHIHSWMKVNDVHTQICDQFVSKRDCRHECLALSRARDVRLSQALTGLQANCTNETAVIMQK